MATRPTFSQTNSVFDVLDTTAYLMQFGRIPGGRSDTTFELKIATIPHFDYGNEAYQAGMAGHIHRYRGIKTYARQLTIEYYEDMNYATHRQLSSWHEYIAGTESGTSGGYKKGADGYSVSDARLNVFDTVGRLIARLRYENMFLQNVGEIQFSGENSAAARISCTFSYDRAYASNLAIR